MVLKMSLPYLPVWESTDDTGVSPRRTSRQHPLPPTKTFPRRVTRIAADSSNDSEGRDSGAVPGEHPKQGQVPPIQNSETPVFYIKGLKGGVGATRSQGDDAGEGRSHIITQRSASGVSETGEIRGMDGEDDTPVWDKIQQSLGLGKWSYIGLGLALFMITLNNVLGLGWLGRAINPDFELVDVESQRSQIEVMRLDDPSNLIPP